jgi:outer membrane autotransporter protein
MSPMKKTFALPAIIVALASLLALATHASANGFATLYWLGSNGTLWSAGNNWSTDSVGTTSTDFSTDAYVNFSATGSSNSTATDLGGDLTISSFTIDTPDAVGISGGNLTIGGDISVGSSSSNNSLQISNGVAVSAASMWAGAQVGANNNQVTVGANSTLTLTDDIYVGGNGSSNNLTITNGGAVSAFYMSAGRETGSNGNEINVGANSTLTLADILDVGFHGSSNNLTITNGGAVSANYTSVGREAGSNNNAILVTSNASMLINNDLIVGEEGSSNSMTISEGGRVTSSVGYIGKNATSANNTVTVTGTNSTWTNNGTLHVGYQGSNNTLTVANNGTVTASSISIASQAGSGGTLNIGTFGGNDTGGTINAPSIAFGNGTAALNLNLASNYTLSSDLTGGNSNSTLNQLGTGTTTLTGNNTYTGAISVNAGKLAVVVPGAFNGTDWYMLNETTISGGTLLINTSSQNGSGSRQNLGNITIATDGTLELYGTASGVDNNIWSSGALFGDGALVKNGPGYQGLTWDGGQGSISSLDKFNGTITVNCGTLGVNSGSGYMAGSGNSDLTVEAGAAFDIRTGGLKINLLTGNGTISSSFSENVTLDFGNNDGPSADFAGVISDGSSGAILSVIKSGTGTQTLSGNNTYTGGTTISGGTLSVTGSVNGTTSVAVNGGSSLTITGTLNANSLLVDPNATLGGSGVIVAQNVIVNGILKPGNSPGTLNVVGNLVLGAGSSTVIEIASPTNFDRIVVSGTATLGGTLNAVAYGGGSIRPGARYDFLQAGSIVGTYDNLIAPDGLRIRFLNSGTVGTLLFGPGSYVPMAINQNQRNVAKALDTFIVATDGDRLAVSIALDSLTTAQFPAAFDQIMPGFYESLANIAIEQAFAQTQMLNQRISSVRLGAAGFQAIGGISQPLLHDKNGKSAAEAKDASPIVESATATNWNSWALGTGMFSRSTNLGSLQNYNNDAGGFLVGADYRWSENFVTGLYGGYDYSYAEYNGGGSTKGNSFSFGTYASYAKDGYYADAVIGGGYTGFQTQRSIEFSTIDRTASADPNSGQFTAGINLGKDFEVGKFTLGPIVGAQYTYAGIGTFTESGAESLDLSLGQQNANSLRTTLGGRIAYTWNLNQKISLIPEVRMFWQHEFLNNPRNISASLDGGNGAAFDFETSDPYRDSVFAGAGITAQFGERWNASLFYNINFGSQTYQSNMVSAGLNFSF